MAVWVYKDDQSEAIDVSFLDNYLQGGWSVTQDTAEAVVEEDLNNDEIREAAKEADIEGWDTKRINTLKKELGYDDEGEHS